jgi:hypothetical protein
MLVFLSKCLGSLSELVRTPKVFDHAEVVVERLHARNESSSVGMLACTFKFAMLHQVCTCHDGCGGGLQAILFACVCMMYDPVFMM